MTMPKLEPCHTCGHPRHTHGAGPCISKTITGPASTRGRAIGEHFEHVGRTETPCPCDGYASARNGASHQDDHA